MSQVRTPAFFQSALLEDLRAQNLTIGIPIVKIPVVDVQNGGTVRGGNSGRRKKSVKGRSLGVLPKIVTDNEKWQQSV